MRRTCAVTLTGTFSDIPNPGVGLNYDASRLRLAAQGVAYLLRAAGGGITTSVVVDPGPNAQAFQPVPERVHIKGIQGRTDKRGVSAEGANDVLYRSGVSDVGMSATCCQKPSARDGQAF
jgi:hypothetical protein